MKYAVVIIDMQKDFFEKESLASQKERLIKNINSLTASARKKCVPVIWVRHVLKADLSDSPLGDRDIGERRVIEGTPGADLLEGLVVEPGDPEIIKKRYSAFFKTNLEDMIKTLGTDVIIVAGINTHACVRMTVIDAYQRDYRVVVAKDCVGSWDQEHHEVSLRYFEPKIAKVLSNQEIFGLFT